MCALVNGVHIDAFADANGNGNNRKQKEHIT